MQLSCSQSSPPLANDNPRGLWRALWAAKRLVPAALLLLGACRPAPALPQAEQTPDKQFILQTLSFEQRRDGQLLWRGRASRGSGDLTVSDVDGLELERIPQTPSEMALHISSDTAHLALADGQAHFSPVLAFDDSGRRLVGQYADYNEATATLHAEGPIVVTAPNATLHATAATLCIQSGSLVLDGPITGRFDSANAAP